MIKIFLILIAVIFIIFSLGMLFFATYVIINKKELKSKEIIIKGNNKKNALILYQKSRHKTATNITMGIVKFLNSKGYNVTVNHPSSINKYNIEEYEIVFLGSAVYMGTVSEPLIKYIESNKFSGKKVIIYLIGLVTEKNTEIELLKNKINGACLVEGIKVKKGEEAKIEDLIEKVLSKN